MSTPRTIEHLILRSTKKDRQPKRRPPKVPIFDDQDELFIELDTIIQEGTFSSESDGFPSIEVKHPQEVILSDLPEGFPTHERLTTIFQSHDLLTIRSLGLAGVQLLCKYLLEYPKVLAMFMQFYPSFMHAIFNVSRDKSRQGWAIQHPDLLYEFFAPTIRNPAGSVFYVVFNLMTSPFRYNIPSSMLQGVTTTFLRAAAQMSAVSDHPHAQNSTLFTACLWRHVYTSSTSPFFWGKHVNFLSPSHQVEEDGDDDVQHGSFSSQQHQDPTITLPSLPWAVTSGIVASIPTDLAPAGANDMTRGPSNSTMSVDGRPHQTHHPCDDITLADVVPETLPPQQYERLSPSDQRVLQFEINPEGRLPEHDPIPSHISLQQVMDIPSYANRSTSGAGSALLPTVNVQLTLQDIYFYHLLSLPLTIGDTLPSKHLLYQRYAHFLSNCTQFFLNGYLIQPQAAQMVLTTLHLWFDIHQYTPRLQLSTQYGSIPFPQPRGVRSNPFGTPFGRTMTMQQATPSFFLSKSIYSLITTLLTSSLVHSQYVRIPFHPRVLQELGSIERSYGPLPRTVHERISHSLPQFDIGAGMTSSSSSTRTGPGADGFIPHISSPYHHTNDSINSTQQQVTQPSTLSSREQAVSISSPSTQPAVPFTGDLERVRYALRSLSSYHAECSSSPTAPYLHSSILVALAYEVEPSTLYRDLIPPALHQNRSSAANGIDIPDTSSFTSSQSMSSISREPISNLIFLTSLHSPMLAITRLVPLQCGVFIKPLYHLMRSLMTNYDIHPGKFFTQRMDTLLLSWWTWVQPWQCLPAMSDYKQLADPNTVPNPSLIQSSQTSAGNNTTTGGVSGLFKTVGDYFSTLFLTGEQPKAPGFGAPTPPPPSDQLLVNYSPWIIASLPLYTSFIHDMMQRVKEGIMSTMVHSTFMSVLSQPIGVHNPLQQVLPLQWILNHHHHKGESDNNSDRIPAIPDRFPISQQSPALDRFIALLNTTLDIGTHTVLMYLKAVLDMIATHPNLRKIIRHWERRIVLGDVLSAEHYSVLAALSHHHHEEQQYHCVQLSPLEQEEQGRDQTGIAQDNGFGFTSLDNCIVTHSGHGHGGHHHHHHHSSKASTNVIAYHRGIAETIRHRSLGVYTKNCQYSSEQRQWYTEESLSPTGIESYSLSEFSIPPINHVPNLPGIHHQTTGVDSRRWLRINGEPVVSTLPQQNLRKVQSGANTSPFMTTLFRSSSNNYQRGGPRDPGSSLSCSSFIVPTTHVTYNSAFVPVYKKTRFPSPYARHDDHTGDSDNDSPVLRAMTPKNPTLRSSPRMVAFSPVVERRQYPSRQTTDELGGQQTDEDQDESRGSDSLDVSLNSSGRGDRHRHEGPLVTPKRSAMKRPSKVSSSQVTPVKRALMNLLTPHKPTVTAQDRRNTSFGLTPNRQTLNRSRMSNTSFIGGQATPNWHLLSQISRYRSRLMEPSQQASHTNQQSTVNESRTTTRYLSSPDVQGQQQHAAAPQPPDDTGLRRAETMFIRSHVKHIMNIESPEQSYIPLFPPLPLPYKNYLDQELPHHQALSQTQYDSMATHYLTPQFADDLRTYLILVRHQRLVYLHAKRILQAGIPLVPGVAPCSGVCLESISTQSPTESSNPTSNVHPTASALTQSRFPHLYGGMLSSGRVLPPPACWPHGCGCAGDFHDGQPHSPLPHGYATLPIAADSHPDYSSDIIMRSITGLLATLQTLFELPQLSAQRVVYNYYKKHQHALPDSNLALALEIPQPLSPSALSPQTPRSQTPYVVHSTTPHRRRPPGSHDDDAYSLKTTLIQSNPAYYRLVRPIYQLCADGPSLSYEFLQRVMYWCRKRGIPIVLLACLVYWLFSSSSPQ